MHERGFSGTGNAGDRDEHPQRNHQIDILQIVRAGAEDAQKAAARLAPQRRNGNAQLAVEISRGKRFAALRKLAARAGEEQFPAMFARAGAQIDDVIGGGNRVGIMLDDKNRVPEVAQALQDFDQAMRVARMEADRRFVENIERANQMRAEGSRELDALRLAAGKCGSKAVQRQVVQADFVEKAKALANLFENLVGDGGLLDAQFEAGR